MTSREINLALRWSSIILASVVSAACSLAPKYERPSIDVPSGFKEAMSAPSAVRADVADDGNLWREAKPADQISRGEWWVIFGDPVLSALETEAQIGSQSLLIAKARVLESRGIRDSARSGLFPSLGAGFGPTKEKQSAASQFLNDGTNVPNQTIWRAQVGASYEADLFGRVSDTVVAADAETQETEALQRSVALAIEADVAQTYFNIRELDTEIRILNATVDLRRRAHQLAENRYTQGDVSELDEVRAQSELQIARSAVLTVQRRRAAYEHSLAVLLGRPPSGFSMKAEPIAPVRIYVPPGLPSTLLERRPDVSAAERAVFAANARIGVAKAAYYPSLSLTGAAGFESATIGDLFKWSSRAFLLGPLAGTALTVPIFDGGKRRGDLSSARAVRDEAAANYRLAVLRAFQEVEDNLSDLRILQGQTQIQADAVQASTRAAHLSLVQYNDGAINYLDVIDADRTVLGTQLTAAQLDGLQAVATVNLIRAMGGGWGPAASTSNLNAVTSN